MKSACFLLFLLLCNVYSSDPEFQTTEKSHSKVSSIREAGRVIAAMPQTTELYKNVRLIYNDPSITRFGSYQPLSNDGIVRAREDARATTWYPNFTKKTKGSAVLIDGNPIYYKMYMPESVPLKAIIFDIYGGSVARHDAIFGWYFNARVLASQGYGITFLSLSDVQDKSFPTSQTDFDTKHFDQLKNEIKTFLVESFASIKAKDCKKLLCKAQTVPRFLMGASFGGLLTLKCATDLNFLSTTTGFLDGFIAQSPPTYQLRYKTNSKFKYLSPISIFDDLTTILNAQLDHPYSPFLDAANLQKPVLLMHSHYDMRIPLDHSLRFYRAARNAGKDNLVSLWIDEQESRHAPIIPNTGTLKQAKNRVNREVKVIEKFTDTKQFSNSNSSYERWMHAYPKDNNADSLASGLNPIKQDDRNEFYRSAIKELSATDISERNIETYVNNKLASKPLDYLLMYNFLMQKNVENAVENAAENAKNSWDGKKFKEKFRSNFPELNEISQNIDSYLSNNPFVTNLPSFLGKKLVFKRQMLDQDHTKEYAKEVAHALLETYIEDFHTFFGKGSASELRGDLEKLTRDKMLSEAPTIIANLKKIFPTVNL